MMKLKPAKVMFTHQGMLMFTEKQAGDQPDRGPTNDERLMVHGNIGALQSLSVIISHPPIDSSYPAACHVSQEQLLRMKDAGFGAAVLSTT